jgi:hypothetical protein
MKQTGKAVITCAATGSIHTPSMSEALPITPDQIAERAIAAAEAAGRQDQADPGRAEPADRHSERRPRDDGDQGGGPGRNLTHKPNVRLTLDERDHIVESVPYAT